MYALIAFFKRFNFCIFFITRYYSFESPIQISNIRDKRASEVRRERNSKPKLKNQSPRRVEGGLKQSKKKMKRKKKQKQVR